MQNKVVDTSNLRLHRFDGLYMDYFDDKDKAIEYVVKMGRDYMRTGSSAQNIADKYSKDGIIVHPSSLLRWFKSLGLPIKSQGGDADNNMKQSTFYLTKDLRNELGRLAFTKIPNTQKTARQFFVNATLEKITGLENNMVMVIYDQTDGQPFVGLIDRSKGDVYCLYLTQASKELKSMMNELCRLGNENGLIFVREHAKKMGFTVL